MWNETKQQQLDDLRRRAQHGVLIPEEQQLLDQLVSELEQQEWILLRPALDQLRHDQTELQANLSQLQAQNAVLAALAERYTDLIARARVQLAGLIREREALREAYDRVLHS